MVKHLSSHPISTCWTPQLYKKDVVITSLALYEKEKFIKVFFRLSFIYYE